MTDTLYRLRGLEWKEFTKNGYHASVPVGDGAYRIYWDQESRTWWVALPFGLASLDKLDSLEAAQSAAEAHYRARMAEGLVPVEPPAEVFPVGDFIRDELAARGWTTADCAARMDGDPVVNELALDLHIHSARTANVGLGDAMARNLAKAFGTSVDLWKNIHAAWRCHSTRAAAEAAKKEPS